MRLLVPPPEAPPEAAQVIPTPKQRVMVEVLNGGRRPGAARAATRMLRRRGLDVVYFGNSDKAVDSTTVIVRRGDPGRGRDVRQALGRGHIVLEPDTLRRVDVSVILGPEFQPRDLSP